MLRFNKNQLLETISIISSSLPFTYFGMVKKELDHSTKTILDVGCGKGNFMRIINRKKKYLVTGIDISHKDISEAKKKNVYSNIVRQNIMEMTIPQKSYDVVISTHVIEHFKKEKGYKLLNKLNNIARRKIIIVTPMGYF